MHLTNLHLIGMHLIGMYLTGVHLTGVHLTGMHLIGMYLTGVHLTGVHLTVGYRPQALLAPMEPKSDVRWLRSTAGYLLVPTGAYWCLLGPARACCVLRAPP